MSVAILYSSSQNSLPCCQILKSPCCQILSQSFIHQVRILSKEKMRREKRGTPCRNPLFIKSEFSRRPCVGIFSGKVLSQSFIHQVRILSLKEVKNENLWFTLQKVAILYSSSQNSLSEIFLWRDSQRPLWVCRNPLFIKSEFSQKYRYALGHVRFMTSQSFIHQVRILSWGVQRMDTSLQPRCRNPLFIKSEFSLGWTLPWRTLPVRALPSQSFIHQVRILSRGSGSKDKRGIWRVAILYSSSQNSLLQLYAWFLHSQ